MTREEAEGYADQMSYRDAVSNALNGKGIPFRKATLTKLHRLLNIIEPMEKEEDAISRAAAIKIMNDMEQEDIELYSCSIPEGFDGERAIKALQSLPSVTPKQKMGHWVNGEYCSECGCDVPAYIIDWKWQKDMDAKYCPMCGAKMVESEDME